MGRGLQIVDCGVSRRFLREGRITLGRGWLGAEFCRAAVLAVRTSGWGFALLSLRGRSATVGAFLVRRMNSFFERIVKLEPSEKAVERLAHRLWQIRVSKELPGDAVSDYAEARGILRSSFQAVAWKSFFGALWVILGCLCLSHIQSHEEPAPYQISVKTRPLEVYRWIDSKERWIAYEWERKEALSFAMSQVALRLAGVIVGAGAIFWFSLKLWTERSVISSTTPFAGPSIGLVVSCFNTLALAGLSVMTSFIGMLDFTEIAVRRSLNFDEIGECLLYALIFFGLAVFFLILAVAMDSLRRVRIPSGD